MPAFSFPWPRFLRFHRSQSRSEDLPPPIPPDDSWYPGPSAPSSHPCSPSTGCPIDYQTSTGHPQLDRGSQAFDGTSGTSPVTPINASTFDSTRQFRPEGAVGRQPTHVTDSISPPQSPQLLLIPSVQALDAPHLRDAQDQGVLNQAHNFVMTGSTFNNVNITTPNQFMKDLLKETIPGAASNSSSRYPPPRCHPGTRLTILERCLDFIANCTGVKKILWVFGAAGVGKSAIMQNIAESPNPPVTSDASVFFSVFGRNDASKTIVTISYQLAAKSEVYRRIIEDEINRDPSLLQSSMPVQFNKFIVQPFIHHPQLNSTARVLIIIDGLDECNNSHTQVELLRLISDFCVEHPSSPIIWLITSRPELHITSFFSGCNIVPTYEKEELLVDSDEARADVERYLRDELTEIRRVSDSTDPEWPEERDLWKLANAAGGLFAYAHTVIRYIGDPSAGNPVSQLSDVLNVIDSHPMIDVPREEHPLALLDALYTRILSKVPSKIMINTRKILSALATHWVQYLWYNNVGDLILLCNWLGMAPDEAYAALNHLRSVLRLPRRDKANEEMLEPFHKSFIDYISDFARSGFSPDIKHEAQQITAKCAFRILTEAPDGVDFGDTRYGLYHGTLTRGPGKGDKISLSWLADGKGGWSDDETRLKMYKLAVGEVVYGIIRGDLTFQTEFCIRVLTTRFRRYNPGFPIYPLRDWVFAESRRDEFLKLGILKQTHLDEVDTSNVLFGVRLQFCGPNTTVMTLSDPWDTSCTHDCKGEWEEGKAQNWETTFLLRDCQICSKRFHCHLQRMGTISPECMVPVLFTSTGRCCVEFRFCDVEDGRSEWTYRFWYDREPDGAQNEENDPNNVL